MEKEIEKGSNQISIQRNLFKRLEKMKIERNCSYTELIESFLPTEAK